MATPKFTSVDGYLESLSDDKAETLRSVVDFILAEFAELSVKVAWNVPQIHLDEAYVFGLSSASAHLSFAPWSTAVIKSFAGRLAADGYVVKKNLFQVPDDWRIDTELLRDLVKARLAELEAP